MLERCVVLQDSLYLAKEEDPSKTEIEPFSDPANA